MITPAPPTSAAKSEAKNEVKNEVKVTANSISVFTNYLSKLKERISMFILTLHIFAINSVFTDCQTYSNWIPTYLGSVLSLSCMWDSWFILLSLAESTDQKSTCSKIGYVVLVSVSRLISFISVAIFTTSGMPLLCVVSIPRPILNVIFLFFIGLNFILDQVETKLWFTESQLAQKLEAEADVVVMSDPVKKDEGKDDFKESKPETKVKP
jgi:hypothetical protein